MNDTKQLEMQLRSWAPRPPSAKLRKRLFALPAVAPEPQPSFRFGWLAPAAAAFLLMGLLFNQHNNSAISGSGHSNEMVAMILSNQNAYLPASFQHGQNSVAAETFEWTNGSGFTSSSGSLSHAKGTNRNE